MQFTQPLFLIGCAAIAIPILIHLFNFRRYKTFYFSNVKMLQDISEKTKRESQLQHLIVLFLRILGIAALAFAFARPFIPNHNFKAQNGNVVSIYIDNSFSMEGNTPDGNLFSDAVSNAKEIINNFSYTDEFILFNNDFSSMQSRLLNKDEALKVLDDWEISPISKTWKDILAFEHNACTQSRKNNILHYYLSDFQKDNFDFQQFNHADSSLSFLINQEAKDINNVAIDSCYFLSPILRVGQQVTLMVRVKNCGMEDVIKLPVKLYINGQQKALAALDIKANSSSDYQMNYSISEVGTQCAVLQIEDAPITFDDKLYFTYQVAEATQVTVVYDKSPNKFVEALYGKDSVFSYTAMSIDRIDYNRLKQSELIVLDEVPSVSSGLASELSKYMNDGGTVLILPDDEMDKASWSSFLSSMNCPQYGELVSEEMKVGSINMESSYFKGSMQGTTENPDMPSALKYYRFSSNDANEKIMTFDNQSPLLSAFNVNKGKLILSAVAMNDDFGNIHKHALFFIPLHNIGIRSIMQQQLYNTIGRNHYQAVRLNSESSENVLQLQSQNDGSVCIPEQRSFGNETMLYFHDQITQAGIYDVMNNSTKIASIAFNFDRKESQLTYYSDDEMEQIMEQQPDEVDLISTSSKDITRNISERLKGEPLWQYFIFFALFCFLAEIAVLRFWGKFRLKKEK